MSWTRFRYHLILGTRRRAPLITPEIEEILYGILKALIVELGGAVVEINGVEDHVHVVFALPPRLAFSDFVRDLKCISNRRLNAIARLPEPFGWQQEYGATTAFPDQLAHLILYVRNQKQHHANDTALDAWEHLPRERDHKTPT